MPLRVWFKWMARQHHILHNPASELELPRIGFRLPKAVLTAAEAERILMQADTGDVLGLRDRAILETLYSTGMRRLELVSLKAVGSGSGTGDGDHPAGEGQEGPRPFRWATARRCGCASTSMNRARAWRRSPDDKVVFLSNAGEPLSLDYLTELVRGYVEAAEVGQARRLSSVPPHHGDADAGRRRGHPFHPGDAGATPT